MVSARFYGGLFGWDTAARGPAERTGGYLTFQLGGRDVAGLGPLVGDDPPSWTIHVACADVDEVEAAVVSNGGATLIAPREVVDAGRSAEFADPTGAVFGGWQAGGHRGAELIGVPGALCWSQLASRNIDAAKRFYGAVFGWVGFTAPYETSTYTRFSLDGHEMAGMVEMDRSWPRDLPSHWLPYFAVEDCDAVALRASQLGGDVPVEPYDLPDIGRAAVLGDPHGAVFSIMERDPKFVGMRSPDDLAADAAGRLTDVPELRSEVEAIPTLGSLAEGKRPRS